MNVAILGATGTFGKALTERMISDTNYHLTLISRHAENVYQSEDRIAVINGNAAKKEDMRKALYGQDVVYCAVSGEELPAVAETIVAIMTELNIKRLLFMGAVGIYNEIPDEMDGDDNLDNEPAQEPNRKAVDVIEASGLNYTILRPGYLRDADAKDYVLTVKGQQAKGYISTIPSVVEFAMQLIKDDCLYCRESVSITKDMESEIEKK